MASLSTERAVGAITALRRENDARLVGDDPATGDDLEAAATAAAGAAEATCTRQRRQHLQCPCPSGAALSTTQVTVGMDAVIHATAAAARAATAARAAGTTALPGLTRAATAAAASGCQRKARSRCLTARTVKPGLANDRAVGTLFNCVQALPARFARLG